MNNNYTNEERALLGLPPRGAAGNNYTNEERAWMGLPPRAVNAALAGNAGANRQAAINAAFAAATAQFQSNFKNEADGIFGTNAQLAQNAEARQQKQAYLNDRIAESLALREASKASAIDTIYNQAEGIFKGENAKFRESILKEVALDDMIIEERIKLDHAKTDAERRAAATKIYNAEKLRDELFQQREKNQESTNEQNARFANLTRGINLNAIPSSAYSRLRAFNKSMKNKAATNIARVARGYTARKLYKPTLNAAREARRAERHAKILANLKRQRNEEAARAAQEEANRKTRLNAAKKAAFEARYGKKPGQGGKRKTQRRR